MGFIYLAEMLSFKFSLSAQNSLMMGLRAADRDPLLLFGPKVHPVNP
jgi:hypothetical protein